MFACLFHDRVTTAPPPDGREGTTDPLVTFAREWAPRVETLRPGVIVLEAKGLTRLFGAPAVWAQRLMDTAHQRGWRIRVAVAGTRVSAILLAVSRPGLTVAAAGEERQALAAVPLAHLEELESLGVSVSRDESLSRPGCQAPAPRRSAAPASRRGRRTGGGGRNYRLAPAPTSAPGEESTSGRVNTDRRAMQDRTRAGVPAVTESVLETLHTWGLTTCGELAALSRASVVARLGATGRRWHEWACGHDWQPFTDDREERRFEETMDLEWPIEGLEPLSFILTRLLEPLCAELRREERGAAVVHTRLDLVTRVSHVRELQLPAPMNDPKVLRTLILLDLDAHPPDAGIDRVTVRLEPLPGRRVQFTLFRRPLPAPDQIATLMARLQALIGQGRCGSPQLLDTHEPGAFAMKPFAPQDPSTRTRRGGATREHAAAATKTIRARGQVEVVDVERGRGEPQATLRRFRRPLAVTVTMHEGRPVRVAPASSEYRGGLVEQCAGPWRTSGAWWRVSSANGATAPAGWNRDEWDVAIVGGVMYRLAYTPADNRWVIEGIWD